MRIQQWITRSVILVAIAICASRVDAHHSVAGYDSQREVTLRGTVVEYNWRNPHVFVVWDVKDQNGKVVRWLGEMSSPTTMISVGMNRISLKPGDEIVVVANPAKSGEPLSVVRKISMGDGKVVVDRLAAQ